MEMQKKNRKRVKSGKVKLIIYLILIGNAFLKNKNWSMLYGKKGMINP